MKWPHGAPRFEDLFGRPPDVGAEAPGRVNLIGEHTDYNGGLVLPTATPQRARMEIARREDRAVSAHSEQMRELATYRLGEEARRGHWIDYVQGVTQALAAAGCALSGFDAHLTSQVSPGAGLASSAALEVALLRALRAAFSLALDDVQIALLGQRAENDLVGAPVGVMDPMASSLGDERSALLLDTRDLSLEKIAIPEGAGIAVVNSGIAHSHARGSYRERRAECERAAELLGVRQLRDLTLDDLPRIEALPDPLSRRARHVLTEDLRVLEAAAALRSGDLEALGALFFASHASMRDDLEISLPEIDRMVDLAAAEPGVYGARLTGGGFGGAVVILAERGAAAAVAEHVAAAYAEQTGKAAAVLMPPPSP